MPASSSYTPTRSRGSAPTWAYGGVRTASFTAGMWEFDEIDATNGSIVATLPAGAPVGTQVMLKRIDLANTAPATVNTVTVVPSGSDTIRNGLTTNTSFPLSGQDQKRQFYRETATQWTALADDPLPSLYPRFPRTLGNQNAVKAGDQLVSGGTANVEAAFATQFTIAANTLTVGQRLHLDVAGIYNITAAGTQRPRVRFGPSATALTSRATLIDFGALNGLISTLANAGYTGDADMVVEAVGTSASMRCMSELNFTTTTTGQVTGFLAGPNPGVPGSVTFDSTVDNILCLTDSFGNTGSGNNSTIRMFALSSYAPPVGSS